MKKEIIKIIIVVIILTGFIIFGLTFTENNKNKNNANYSSNIQEKKEKYKNFSSISSREFQTLMNEGEYIVIDVRTKEEIEQSKIKNDALEIDFYNSNFRIEIDKLNKNKKYLIYCRSGNRSGKTVQIMKELGFKEVYDLDGGIIAWNKNGLKLNQ